MSGRHRSPEPMTRHRTTNWPVVLGGSLSFAVASAGVLAGAIVHFSSPEPAAPAPQAPQAADSAPVTQNGTVIAVTADSVTTRSDDGLIQTYRLTPDTYAVTADRRQPASPAASFAVDDRVSVFATVEAGQQVATAVADQAAVGPDGPPMDYLAAS
ncbi:hypothetical protein AU195_11540 [Mycobacterium sp. IS-1496]|uniref:hypothetical protein n=1 Tax=Mycobacterium sp. IS-1496 TaxID=1772284 RepID=UPI0007417AFF|nr:hypothetical protein [Mycobacterium sp. IS-1496]KUI31063.1 hypothetical protein AU195_11540 [Mycobacterium sp. IS-1496]